MRQDHYEVLGVNPAAPDEVIRAVYKALAAKYHPDRNPGDRHAELKVKRINAAWEVLGDPLRRKQYDDLTQGPEEDENLDKPSDTVATTSTPPHVKRKKRAPENDGQPRWKVPGEDERNVRLDDQGNLQDADSSSPGSHGKSSERVASKPATPTLGRMLLAFFSVIASITINLLWPSTDPYQLANPNAALFGSVLGCGLLGLFVYWIAGKVEGWLCAAFLVLLCAISVALHSGNQSGPSVRQTLPQPITQPATVQPTPNSSRTQAEDAIFASSQDAEKYPSLRGLSRTAFLQLAQSVIASMRHSRPGVENISDDEILERANQQLGSTLKSSRATQPKTPQQIACEQNRQCADCQQRMGRVADCYYYLTMGN